MRSPARAIELDFASGVDLVQGDLDDAAALDRLETGADGLFHVAGWFKLGLRDPSSGERTNVEGTRNVLAAAQRAGTPKVVYTSTLAVNSDTGGRFVDESHEHTGAHLSEYDRTKAEAHAIAKEFAAAGLPVVIVMPGAITAWATPPRLGSSSSRSPGRQRTLGAARGGRLRMGARE